MSTVLITGASSGIGLASAVAAARAGWTTVATVRRPGSETELLAAAARAGVTVEVAQLDITDAASVQRCVRSVVDRHGRLDAVVNNAGISSGGTLELTSMAQLRAGMEVNFFGVALVSQVALPHLRASRGRLITIGSVRGVVGQPFNEPYAAAKFAVEGMMESLAPVAADLGVAVSLIEPAAVLDTAFGCNEPDPDLPLVDAGPYAETYHRYRGWARTGAIEGAQQSADVAAVVVRVLTDPRPPFRVQTSEYARHYVTRKLADTDGEAIQTMARSWLRADGCEASHPAPVGADLG